MVQQVKSALTPPEYLCLNVPAMYMLMSGMDEVILLESVNCEFPVAEIYRKVNLQPINYQQKEIINAQNIYGRF